MARFDVRVNIDPSEDDRDNDSRSDNDSVDMAELQGPRRQSRWAIAYEPEISPTNVQRFLKFYKKSINHESLMAQLGNFEFRRPSLAPPHFFEEKRKSHAPGLQNDSLHEDVMEMEELPQFDFREFVTNLRKKDDESYDATVKDYKKSNKIFRIGVLDRELATIEGKYGPAVMSYFSFLRHVIFVNVVLVLLSLPLIVPHYAFQAQPDSRTTSCSKNYSSSVQRIVDSTGDQFEFDQLEAYLSQIFTGKGILERYIFYGLFEHKYELPSVVLPHYDMSLATTIVTAAGFVVSLIMILARASVYFSSFTSSKEFSATRYTTLVLGSWNYRITEKQSRQLQHSFIRNKLSSMLLKDSRHATRLGRGLCQTVAMYAVRSACHLFVASFLGGCGYAIFLIQEFSDDQLSKSQKEYEKLAVSFLPSFTITALYMAARPLFEALMPLESYSSEVAMMLNIARAAGLRLASLVVMFAAFFNKVLNCQSKDKVCGNCQASRGEAQEYCWETYVGQQMYKLVIMDFLMLLFSVFILETPRGSIHKAWKDKWTLVKKVGLPEFNIPKLVLDASYTLTLCWISFLFCPFVPVMTLATASAVYALRKFSLNRNFQLSEKFSSTAEVRVYFLFMLCPFLVLSLVIVGVCMVYILPSQGCGPYRVLSSSNQSMFEAVLEASRKANAPPLEEGIKFIFNPGVLLFVVFVLSMMIFYQWSIAQGNERLLALLDDSKQMLIKDKKAIWKDIHKKTEQIVEEERRRASRASRLSLSADDRSKADSAASNGESYRDAPSTSGLSKAESSSLHRSTRGYDTPLNAARLRLHSTQWSLASQSESGEGYYGRGKRKAVPAFSEFSYSSGAENY